MDVGLTFVNDYKRLISKSLEVLGRPWTLEIGLLIRRSLVRSQVEEPPNSVACHAHSPAIAVGLFAFWGSK